MFTKISVLVPTRKRIDRLGTMIDSYECTTRGVEHLSELVFRTDDDDVATKDFLFQRCLSRVDNGHRLVAGPRLQGYRSLPVFFNAMLAVAAGDVLMCGNDDMIFVTPGWATLILAEANKYPDGLFDIGVSTHNETHYPFSIVSRQAVDAMGFIWDPRIFWGDIFLRDAMAVFGRSVMLPTVQIDHDWVGHVPDQTFLEGDQQDITRRDPTYWTGTHVVAVNDAVNRLSGLNV